MESQKRGGPNKVPFDKKTYRLKKYSNKYKVDQWEEKRKKSALYKFRKEIAKENGRTPGDQTDKTGTEHEESSSKGTKKVAFASARREFLQKQEDKKRKQEEILRRQLEKEEAVKKSKEKKLKRLKALSHKTKRGQPVMKERLELLLEKIQQIKR